MASSSTRNDLKALHRLIDQADLVLATIPDPHPSIPSARESLNAALALSKDLITRKTAKALDITSAAALGSRGGTKTAERGPEYFKRISAMRKKKAGGRPRKQSD